MIQEYAFRVKTLENPLMRFTAEQPGHRILITLLRDAAHALEERAIFTFLGDVLTTKRFLAGEFTKRYGTTQPIHEEADYLSVEVSTHLLPMLGNKTPNQITYEILGPDATFLPLLVLDGWLHVRVLSANEQAGQRFLQFLGLMKEHLRPIEYHLYPVRPYRPEARLREAAEEMTHRQQEVLTTAYEMGYWSEPRRCNLEDIATRLQVSKAAVHKSLAAGERKVIASFFEELRGAPGAPSEGTAAAAGGASRPRAT